MNKLDMAGIISNTQKPNIMQFLFELSEDIDREAMERALNRTIRRYPYFSFRFVKTEQGYDKVENNLPLPVLATTSGIVLGSEAVNYHWVAVGCEGRQLKLVMHHSMADATSALWFYKTLLYCYVTDRYGIELDPTGILLPESDVQPDEDQKVVSPVDNADGTSRQTVEDPFQIPEPLGDEFNNYYYTVTIPEDAYLSLCRDNNASPVAMTTILMAKTFKALHPTNDKRVYAGLAANVRNALGCPRSRHTNAYLVFVQHDPAELDLELPQLGATTRERIRIQTSDSNLRFVHNTAIGCMARIRNASTAEERRKYSMQMYATLVGNPTYTISYVGNSEWGALAPFVTHALTFAFRGKMGLEINTAGGNFCISWMQSFDDDTYVRTFQELLGELGVSCDVQGPFPLPWPRCEL